MTGPEALRTFQEWAHQHEMRTTLKGNRLVAAYGTVAVEFSRVGHADYQVRVVEGLDNNVRWAERLQPDGPHVVRTRVDQPRDFKIVEPGGHAAVRGALECAWLEALWWHHCKTLF